MHDYQGKFDSMLRTVKDDIFELKTKFSVLEHGSMTTVTAPY